VPGSGGTGREHTGVPVTPQSLTKPLERRPLAPGQARRIQAPSHEATGVRQIGDALSPDLPAPQVARHLTVRWNCELGEGAIPLRPGCLLTVGEVARDREATAFAGKPSIGLEPMPSVAPGFPRWPELVDAQ
jgi:hypothetical protein